MIKKIQFTLLLMLMSFFVLAQDANKNLGFYYITQFAITNVLDVKTVTNSYGGPYEYPHAKQISLNTSIGGFILPQKLSFGMSFGMSSHTRPDFNIFPIGVETRYYLIKKPSSPYFIAQVRKHLKLGEKFYNGFEKGFGLGYKFKISHGTFIVFDVILVNRTINRIDNTSEKFLIRGIDFSLGFVFW